LASDLSQHRAHLGVDLGHIMRDALFLTRPSRLKGFTG
jgi:hypothetical protein